MQVVANRLQAAQLLLTNRQDNKTSSSGRRVISMFGSFGLLVEWGKSKYKCCKPAMGAGMQAFLMQGSPLTEGVVPQLPKQSRLKWVMTIP